jgi:hypothetical protein
MVAPLETHASGFLTALSQAPKVFTLHGVPGGSRNSPVRDPTTFMELRCDVDSSAHTHLTGVRQREVFCSGSGVLKSWDSMVVET